MKWTDLYPRTLLRKLTYCEMNPDEFFEYVDRHPTHIVQLIKKEITMSCPRTLRGLKFTQHVADTVRGGGKMIINFPKIGEIEIRRVEYPASSDSSKLPVLFVIDSDAILGSSDRPCFRDGTRAIMIENLDDWEFIQYRPNTKWVAKKLDENYLTGSAFRKYVTDSLYEYYKIPYLRVNGKAYKVIGATDGSSSSVFKLLVMNVLQPSKLLGFEFEYDTMFEYRTLDQAWRPETCIVTYADHDDIAENLELYVGLSDSKFVLSGVEMRFLDVWSHPVLNLLTFQVERDGKKVAYRSTRGTTLRVRRLYLENGIAHEILLDHVKRMDLD